MIGAGDFIGAAIAKKFAAEGFTVFAGRRNGDKLAPLVAEIEAAGGRVVGRSLDARKEDDIAAFLREADARRRSRSASSTSAPTSTSRCSTRPSACSARSGRWPATAGFLAGREAARLMLPRGRGAIFFTGATASLRGGSATPPSPRQGRPARGGAERGARARAARTSTSRTW